MLIFCFLSITLYSGSSPRSLHPPVGTWHTAEVWHSLHDCPEWISTFCISCLPLCTSLQLSGPCAQVISQERECHSELPIHALLKATPPSFQFHCLLSTTSLSEFRINYKVSKEEQTQNKSVTKSTEERQENHRKNENGIKK